MIITVSTSFCRVHLTATVHITVKPLLLMGTEPVLYLTGNCHMDPMSRVQPLDSDLGAQKMVKSHFQPKDFFSFWTKIEQTGFLLLK